MSNLAFFFLLVYVVFSMLRPQEYLQFMAGVPYMKVLFLLIAVCLLFSDKTYKKIVGSQFFIMLAVLIIAFVSTLVNFGVSIAISKSIDFFISISLMLFVGNLTISRRRMNLLMLTVIICTTLISYHAWQLVNYGVGYTGIKVAHERVTYVGLFSDPNDLGQIIMASLPLIAVIFIMRNPLFKVFGCSLILMHLYAMYHTNSRGTMLGLLSVLGFYLYKKYGVIKTAIASSVLFPLFLIVAPSRFSEIDATEASAQGRVYAWYEGFQMFFWKPILGVGLDGFREYHHLTAHNSYVLVLSELGFFGYCLWMAFVLVTLKMIFSLFHAEESEFGSVNDKLSYYADIKEVKIYVVALLCCLIALLSSNFFLSRAYQFPIYLYAGMVIALYKSVSLQWPEYKLFKFKDILVKTFGLAVLSIVALYLIIKVLL